MTLSDKCRRKNRPRHRWPPTHRATGAIEEQVGLGNDRRELEPEDTWLRYRVRRLRAVLHRVKDPEALTLLHELITDAEDRLDLLEKKRAHDMLRK